MHGVPGRCAQLAMALFALAYGAPAARGASPSDRPSRLSVVRTAGAESCPSATALAIAVQARLGRNPFADAATDQVEVTFSTASTPSAPILLRADIRVRDPQGLLVGERSLSGATGATCETLGSATALAIALHIDPDAALASSNPAPAPAPAPVPAPAPAPVPAPAPAPVPAPAPAPIPVPDRAPSHQTTMVAGIGVMAEGLPGISPVVMLGAGVEVVPRLWIRLQGMFAPEQRTSDERFAFGLTAAFAGACFDALRGGTFGRKPSISVAPCASVGLGEVHSVVFKLLPTDPGTRLWVSGAFEVLTRFSPGSLPLDIELGFGVLTPFVRHRFYVIGETSTAFQQPAIVPIGKLMVGVHFL